MVYNCEQRKLCVMLYKCPKRKFSTQSGFVYGSYKYRIKAIEQYEMCQTRPITPIELVSNLKQLPRVTVTLTSLRRVFNFPFGFTFYDSNNIIVD